MKYLSLLLLLFFIAGCTDAVWDKEISAYGEQHAVVCYSGGKEIYRATTTGVVTSLVGGGWGFRSVQGEYVQTFADCFVSFKK